VIAARDVQAFSTYEDTFWNSIRAGSPHIDFGAWEGPVFRFTPAHPEGIAFTPRPYDPLRPGVF
jgi:hypothetical protein